MDKNNFVTPFCIHGTSLNFVEKKLNLKKNKKNMILKFQKS